MTYLDILIIYLIGGLTFFPFLILIILIHAYFTFPLKDASTDTPDDLSQSLFSNDNEAYGIKSGRSLHDLAERFQRHYESDVASGYFAVCREYVPGGVNGKPPERTTPAGLVIAAESPSVYQSMYRSLFDRRQAPTIHPGQENGKTVKRARNIFFVVLRHGHLMLYEDSDQVEVKYVIAIEQYNVSIYSGEDNIPEGELWIKRNAIRLSRKASIVDDGPKPFYFFSENCSNKEDFYIALLQNQEQKPGAPENSPRPLQFDPKLAIGLVQRLHSSEEQLQTRWLNALAGRLFLALYKTPEVEDFVRKKITKKIARAKKPTILSDIVLRSIDMGDSAPQITNPRLKDLTIDGDCCAEMDVKYSGGFRLEIATTARIDLGARFKAREVTIILAVVLKKLNGHCLIKFKPPPSNRIWVSFEAMPDMDMIIEPLVSSRQITYGFILRTIEARIREVLAETIVLPHWDDIPFTDTSSQEFRGGIWAPQDSQSTESPDQTAHQTAIPDEALEDEVDIDTDSSAVPSSLESNNERVASMPIIHSATALNETTNAAATSLQTSADLDPTSTTLHKGPVPPKALRSRSFASAANPLLSMDNANVDSLLQVEKIERSKKQSIDATSAMRTISNKSRPSSPPDSSMPSAFDISSPQEKNIMNVNRSSSASHSSGDDWQGVPFSATSGRPSEAQPSSIYPSTSSHTSEADRSDITPKDIKLESRTTSSFSDRKQAVAAVNAATAAAKKWSWGVLNRNNNGEQRKLSSPNPNRTGSPAHPIGRGQPLPPPGQPLPFPEGQRPKTNGALIGKRKPVPPPYPPQQPGTKSNEETKVRSAPTPPPLPARRRQSALLVDDSGIDGMLVVEAPPDSEPASPDKKKEESSSMESLQSARNWDHSHEDQSLTKAPQLRSDDDHQIIDTPGDTNKDSLSEEESIAAWQDI